MNASKTLNNYILLVVNEIYENFIKKDLSNEQIKKVVEIIKTLAS